SSPADNPETIWQGRQSSQPSNPTKVASGPQSVENNADATRPASPHADNSAAPSADSGRQDSSSADNPAPTSSDEVAPKIEHRFRLSIFLLLAIGSWLFLVHFVNTMDELPLKMSAPWIIAFLAGLGWALSVKPRYVSPLLGLYILLFVVLFAVSLWHELTDLESFWPDEILAALLWALFSTLDAFTSFLGPMDVVLNNRAEF
ncbi:MAG: hypothetical protein OXB95_07530, partial [Rhodobacteraceae bacterium]|nr:hypothetical protein [Paracoccaceae bacterium]